MEHFHAALELKLSGDPSHGEFEGYGAVFGNVDAHGDAITRGAFSESIAEHRARGSMPAMYVMHGPAMGGDPLPAGVWTSVEEDEHGLRVKGRVSALDTDFGRRVCGLMRDGALRGLSIGFRARQAAYRQKPSEPRRTLKAVDLVEVSLVTDPSNALARVDQIKSALAANRFPTLREFEERLREMGFSRSQAAQIAERGFKSLPRDEGDEQAIQDAASTLKSAVAGFSMPSFR